MALRFYDGWDHYPYTEMPWKWSGAETGANQAGRFGGSSVALTNRTYFRSLDSQQEWFIGLACYVNVSSGRVLRLYDAAGAGGHQMTLYYDAISQRLRVYRGDVAVLLGTCSNQLSNYTWHYIEWYVKIDDTVGATQVRVNGATVLNLSNQDTRSGGNASADTIYLGGGDVAWNADDLYVCDASGPAPYNTFLGDVRAETLLPNGNGNSSQFVGSDGNSVDNYLLVDEADSDDDTTYVESATSTNKDTYAYPDISASAGTIYGVQILPWARKTDAGVRTIATVARLAGGTEEDSADVPLNASYSYPTVGQIRTTKPGGGAWTVADVNGAEFGVKVV